MCFGIVFWKLFFLFLSPTFPPPLTEEMILLKILHLSNIFCQKTVDENLLTSSSGYLFLPYHRASRSCTVAKVLSAYLVKAELSACSKSHVPSQISLEMEMPS